MPYFISAWSVKIRRPSSRRCRDARAVCGDPPPPPRLCSSCLSHIFSSLVGQRRVSQNNFPLRVVAATYDTPGGGVTMDGRHLLFSASIRFVSSYRSPYRRTTCCDVGHAGGRPRVYSPASQPSSALNCGRVFFSESIRLWIFGIRVYGCMDHWYYGQRVKTTDVEVEDVS